MNINEMVRNHTDLIEELDSTFVGDNKPTDKKGRMFEQGICMLHEEPTKELIFDKLYDDVEYEVPYKNLTELSPEFKKSPKLDALINGDTVVEFKKLHLFYNNGVLNEYTYKGLTFSLAAQQYFNPNTGKAVASNSVVGDIEKLLMFGDKYKKIILVELWEGGGYTFDRELKGLDYLINEYYETSGIVEYKFKDTLHPYMPYGRVFGYEIFNKKG